MKQQLNENRPWGEGVAMLEMTKGIKSVKSHNESCI